MATILMFGEEVQQERSNMNSNPERSHNEAAVYGMIKMILGNDAAKPAIAAIDKAKALVLRS